MLSISKAYIKRIQTLHSIDQVYCGCDTMSLVWHTGVGKTTLVQKACEALVSSGAGAEGFYTEEVREGGRRVGFDVVTVAGERGHLSRIR